MQRNKQSKPANTEDVVAVPGMGGSAQVEEGIVLAHLQI